MFREVELQDIVSQFVFPLASGYFEKRKEKEAFFFFPFCGPFLSVALLWVILLIGRSQLLPGSLLFIQHSLQILVNVFPQPFRSSNGKGSPTVSNLGYYGIHCSFPKSCPQFYKESINNLPKLRVLFPAGTLIQRWSAWWEYRGFSSRIFYLEIWQWTGRCMRHKNGNYMGGLFCVWKIGELHLKEIKWEETVYRKWLRCWE